MKRFLVAIWLFFSILAFSISASFIIGSIISKEIILELKYGIFAIFSGGSLLLSFMILELQSKKEREEKDRLHFDKYINPNNAKILRFNRKNIGVKICKLSKDDVGLAFFNERLWAYFQKEDDGTMSVFVPPEVNILKENAKWIELVKIEDLPRIS
jgi:hypothetical protein